MSATLQPSVDAQDHIQGNVDAPVQIVEFGDYQCPYCGQAFPVIKEIQTTFGNQVSFVFRNFPLTEIHEYAQGAALAAEAAGKQGKFWEMHDLIYENQRRLDSEGIMAMAHKIGLDISTFEKDIQSASVKNKVEADFESGVRSGVNGTPSFYVNGRKFDGSANDLLEMLKENS